MVSSAPASATSASTPAITPGATPKDPTAAVSLPAGSPAAALPTTTVAGAAATATPATAAPTMSVKAVLVLTFFGLWILFGLIGIVLSLVCFGYSGSVGEKIFGVIAALLLGPFYFLYYFSSGSYCKRMPPTLF